RGGARRQVGRGGLELQDGVGRCGCGEAVRPSAVHILLLFLLRHLARRCHRVAREGGGLPKEGTRGRQAALSASTREREKSERRAGSCLALTAAAFKWNAWKIPARGKMNGMIAREDWALLVSFSLDVTSLGPSFSVRALTEFSGFLG
ncbi:unnamed protein product, partial [Scytosiphon promiscuus]